MTLDVDKEKKVLSVMQYIQEKQIIYFGDSFTISMDIGHGNDFWKKMIFIFWSLDIMW